MSQSLPKVIDLERRKIQSGLHSEVLKVLEIEGQSLRCPYPKNRVLMFLYVVVELPTCPKENKDLMHHEE